MSLVIPLRARKAGHTTPRARDWVLRRIEVACGLQALFSEDSASASRGREGSRDEVARQEYKMLMECQRVRPHKCLRIRALRRSQHRSAPGARNNFHSACDVYLMFYALPASFGPSSPSTTEPRPDLQKSGTIAAGCCCLLSHTGLQREWNARS
jgi:hypothetical protein